MNTSHLARHVLPAVILATLASTSLAANAAVQTSNQQAQITSAKSKAAQQSNTATTLDSVVVTGSASVGGVKQLDASYAITSLSQFAIKDVNPSSTADLLKAVPTIWVESTGGQAGANVFVRGFPGAGDARFVSTELNGSPLFGTSGLSFMSTPDLFRMDDTIKRVEVLRGGPSPIFAAGQPGATVNFIQKDGTDTPWGAGSVRATLGQKGYRRLDVYWGGELGDNWYLAGGGFARQGDGVHDAQYDINRGGQFDAILTKKFDDDAGSLAFYGRHTNDDDGFLTSVPMVSVNGKLHPMSQFDPRSDTLLGNDIRHTTMEVSPGTPPGTRNVDLAKGRGINLSVFGSKFNLKFGDGWTISNHANLVGGNVPTVALFNGNTPPMSVGDYIASSIATANANPDVVAAAGMATSGTAVYTHGGGAVNPNELLLNSGLWVVNKHIHSFTDEVRLSKALTDNNTLTFGAFYANYGTRDQWDLGNNILTTLQNNAQLVDVTLNNGVVVSHNGFSSPSSYAFAETWSGRNIAGYLSDEWVIGPWRLDAGARWEHQRDKGYSANSTTVDLDGNPATLYNNGASVLTGTRTQFNESASHVSWTAGANYSFTDHMSAFVRLNSGQLFPMFDDIQGGTPSIQTVKQYELGFKAEDTHYSAYLTAFYNKFSNLPFQAFVEQNGQLVNVTLAGGSKAKGVGVDFTWRPIADFSVHVTGDYLKANYTNYGDYSDNQVERQPKLLYRVTPAWMLPTHWGMFRLFATFTHVGQRYGDIANDQILPSYHTIDAGAELAVGDHWDFRLDGRNITDTLALTEGNNRAATGGAAASSIIYGRSIFGRMYTLSAKYSF
ncbi:MAG TPA: TonB-dependent receptor [Rhodanobacteraceae bacterium]